MPLLDSAAASLHFRRSQMRFPRTLVLLAGGFVLLPSLLNLLGFDFSLPGMPHPALPSLSGDPILDIRSRFAGNFLHEILEWTAVITAFFTALLAIIHYRVTNDPLTPIIGGTFLASGILDAFHLAVSEHFIILNIPIEQLSPFSWGVSRFFNSYILLTAGTIFLLRGSSWHSRRVLAMITGSFTLLGLIFLIFTCSESSLPQIFFPEDFLKRPFELVPLAAYLVAALWVLPQIHRRDPSLFSYSLYLSIVPQIATQLHIAFGSGTLYDNHFAIAHYLKIVAYAIPLWGLCLDYFHTHQDFEQEYSQRKEAEKASSEQALRLHAIIEEAVDGIITIDSSGHILEFNKSASHIFGYSEEEARGADVSILIPEPFSIQHHSYIENYLRTGLKKIIGTTRELFARRKDGTVFPASVAVSEIRLKDRILFSGLIRDLTTEKAREEAFHETQKRLTSVITSAPLILFGTDKEGLITFYEGKGLEALNRNPGELVGQSIYKVVRDSPVAKELICRAFSGDNVSGALEVQGNHFAVQYDPILDASGTVQGITGVAFDITDRVRATEERDHFFSLSLEMFCIAGLSDGFFKRINPSFEKILGYSLEELYSKPFIEFVHPDDRAATLEQGKLLAKGHHSVNFENRYKCADGSWKWISWDTVRSGDILFATGRDMTEQKAMAEALKESEERYREIFESASDLIQSVGPDGSILYVNQAWEETLGYSKEEIRHFKIFDIIHPASLDHCSRLFQEVTGGRAFEKIEADFQTKDGRTLTLEGSVNCKFVGGKPIATRGIFRDVTKRKEVEIMKNEFISVVSHELRTPLTSIRGSLGLIEGGALGAIPAEIKELIVIARNNTDRLIRLINDILDLEKMESGKLELKLTKLPAEEIIETSLKGIEGMAQEAGVLLSGQSSVEPSTLLKGDRDRLIQVLTNLISNAIKFSPNGAMVTVQAEQVRSDRIRITVKDQGPGIPPDKIGRLFQKFQQLDASDTRAKGGTGLGLAISKAIVEQHGGEMGVESRIGEGTQFYFELPVFYSTLPPIRLDEKVASRRYSVLLVEDDPDLLRTLSILLTYEGYRPLQAKSLHEAEEILDKVTPDVIILDLGLPDGDGATLMEKVWKQHSIPFVILSGRSPDEASFGTPLLIDWITKPFPSDGRLLQDLRKAIRIPGKAKVLVVDDDPGTRTVIRTQLATMNVECFEAADGLSAIEAVHTHNPDLIILDLEIPLLDGYDVVEVLRKEKARVTPLLVYTGEDLNAAEMKKLSLGMTRHLTKSRCSEVEFIKAIEDFLNGILTRSNSHET